MLRISHIHVHTNILENITATFILENIAHYHPNRHIATLTPTGTYPYLNLTHTHTHTHTHKHTHTQPLGPISPQCTCPLTSCYRNRPLLPPHNSHSSRSCSPSSHPLRQRLRLPPDSSPQPHSRPRHSRSPSQMRWVVSLVGYAVHC